MNVKSVRKHTIDVPFCFLFSKFAGVSSQDRNTRSWWMRRTKPQQRSRLTTEATKRGRAFKENGKRDEKGRSRRMKPFLTEVMRLCFQGGQREGC